MSQQQGGQRLGPGFEDGWTQQLSWEGFRTRNDFNVKFLFCVFPLQSNVQKGFAKTVRTVLCFKATGRMWNLREHS